MTAALVVIGAVATAVAALWAALQIGHHVRFRRPLITIDAAEMPVKAIKGGWAVGGSPIGFSVRGAGYPITLSRREFYWLRRAGTEMVPTVGLGTPQNLTLPAYESTFFELETIGTVFEGQLEPTLDAQIVLSGPHDFFHRVHIRFELSQDRSRYRLRDDEELRHMMRIMGTPVSLPRRLMRRVRRLVAPVRPNGASGLRA